MTMHKVIYDTDPGVDDAMALLFLHQHPEIDLIGITTVFGNAAIEITTRNALYLKERWQIAAPVARGAGDTITPSGATFAPPTFIHGDNGLGNVEGVPETVATQPDPRPAHRFIIDLVKANPGEVSLVAVGRMTNLALALREAPEIAGLVKQVVIMGGSVGTPGGNFSPVAEANIHGDPEAADMVMTAPWKVVMVGLNVTHKVVMSRAFLADIARAGGPRAQFLNDLSQFYIDFYSAIVEDGMVVHDSCAAVYVVAPDLFSTRSGPIRVVCGGIAHGQTIQRPDDRAYPATDWNDVPAQLACVGVDAEGVLELLRETLSRSA